MFYMYQGHGLYIPVATHGHSTSTTKKTKEWTTFGATFSPLAFVLPPANTPRADSSCPPLPFHPAPLPSPPPRPAPLPSLRPARQVARARTPDHPAPLPSPPSYRSLLPLHQRRVTQRGSPPPIVVVEAGQAAARSSRALVPPRSERPHGKPSPPSSWSSRSCSPSPGQDMIAQASRQAV